MNSIYRSVIAVFAIFTNATVSADQINAEQQLPTIHERRLKLAEDKITSVGCIFDAELILKAKDGEPVIFKHPKDPRGDITVTFNLLVLPAGNWVLFGAKNSINGDKIEDTTAGSPKRMEAVSAVFSGTNMNMVPRDFDSVEVHNTVRVHIARIWDSAIYRHTIHGFDYEFTGKTKVGTRVFNASQLPIINILNRNDKGEVVGGALCWFENQSGEQAAPRNR